MLVILIRTALGFVVLAAIYVAVAAYMRWDRRLTLEEEFDAGAGQGLTREDYVDRGLARYERSRSKKALLGIFALPFLALAIVFLLVNWG